MREEGEEEGVGAVKGSVLVRLFTRRSKERTRGKRG